MSTIEISSNTIWKFTNKRGAVPILLDSTLRFSSPISLNDLFEYSFRSTNYESSKESSSFQRCYDTYRLKFSNNISVSDFRDQVYESPSHRLGLEFLWSKIESYGPMFKLQRVGVTCFSKILLHHLLWGHYADGGRGVAIGFDRNHASLVRAELASLNTDQPSDVTYGNPIKSSDGPVFPACLLRKSESWAYEQEVRSFSYLKTTHEVKGSFALGSFHPSAITSIAITPFVDPDCLHAVNTFRMIHPVRILGVIPTLENFNLKVMDITDDFESVLSWIRAVRDLPATEIETLESMIDKSSSRYLQ